MNRIINVNLAGQALAIDEGAYDILRDYMKSLERHFSNTPSGHEILEDIEARMAEMFNARLRGDKTFIDQAVVKEVIELMGNPSEMDSEQAEENSSSEQEEHYDNAPQGKKLFRDPDDKVLGGVCAGIAAYFNVDASMIRLATIILVMFGGLSILPYIILWIILPEAKTPRDKSRMRGQRFDINKIANNIRQEAENVAGNLKKNDSVNRTFQAVINVFKRFFNWLGKILGAGLLSILVIVGVALTVSMLVSLSADPDIYINGSGFKLQEYLGNGLLSRFFIISVLLTLIIPVGAVIYLLIIFIFNIPLYRFKIKSIFLAWLISLAIMIGLSVYIHRNTDFPYFEEFRYEIPEDNANRI